MTPLILILKTTLIARAETLPNSDDNYTFLTVKAKLAFLQLK